MANERKVLADYMDFKQLSYMIKVAECRSITRAARELYISQPSLSQFIAKAEDELGIKIFDRATTPLSLTYAGEKYLEAAVKIIKINDNIKSELRDIMDYRKGRLVVGIPKERCGYMMPPILKEFKQKYPGIEVQMVEANSDALRDSLKKGTADLIIIPWLEPEPEPEFLYLPVYEEALLFVAGDGVIDKSFCQDGYSNVIDWKKVEQIPFIVLKSGHGIRWMTEKLFKKYQINPVIAMETTSNSNALRLTAYGLGVTIVPEMTVNMLRGAQRFNTYFVDKEPVTWRITAVVRKDSYRNKAQNDFLEIARKIFNKSQEQRI